MKKWVLYVLIVTLVGINLLPGLAISQQWRIFSTENSDLPSNFITALTVGQNGTIWVGTDNGLARYDGAGRFATFNSENSALPSNLITALTVDEDGNLWIGTDDGLVLYDGAGQFTTFNSENSNLPSDSISVLTVDADNTLWVGLTSYFDDGGLARYNGDGKFTIFNIKNSDLPANKITALTVNRNGTLWVGAWNRLNPYYGIGFLTRYNGHGTFTTFNLDQIFGIHPTNISALEVDKNGALWFGAEFGHTFGIGSSRLARYDEYGTFTTIHTDNSNWPGHPINELIVDKDGTLWIGTEARTPLFDLSVGGLARYDGDDKFTIFNVKNSGLPFPSIRALTVDQDGVLWIGTEDGLARYDGDGRFATFNTENSHLPHDVINTLTVDNEDTLWVGTNIGLARYDGGRRFMTFNTDNSDLPSNWIDAVAVDQEGTLWVGTRDGLARYDGGKHFTTFNERTSHLPGNRILALTVDNDGVLWVCTTGGLAWHDGDGTFATFNTMNSHLPYTLTVDNDSVIWVGMGGYGLARYDGDGRYVVFDTDNSALPSDWIGALVVDKEGTLWIGTNGGLARYHGVGYFTTFNRMNSHLPDNRIRALTIDGDGVLWVGTGGDMVGDGLTSFPISRAKPQTWLVSTPGTPIGYSVVRFDFTGWEAYTPPNDVRFSYQIDGRGFTNDGKWFEGQEWSLPESTTFVFTPPLENGEHHFRFRAHSIFGDADKTPAEYTFTVDTLQPTAIINYPTRESRVSGSIKIVGTAIDNDFNQYTIEYQGDAAQEWIPIGRVSQSPVRNGVLGIWDVAELEPGTYTLKLTATDMLEHVRSDTVRVEVVSALEKVIAREGGHVSESTGKVDFYIPPNALERDVEITLTILSKARLDELGFTNTYHLSPDILPTDLVLEFKPEGLSLRKPATVTVSYSDINGVEDEWKLSFFALEKETQNWQRIGGTVNVNKKTIKAVIKKLSIFAVMEDRRISIGKPSISQIHCQPRVFSPKGNVHNTETDISFKLGKESLVTIKVYDIDGRLRRVLTKEQPMSQGIQVVPWNGRSDAGKILPSGIYLIAITIGEQTEIKTVVIQNR